MCNVSEDAEHLNFIAKLEPYTYKMHSCTGTEALCRPYGP